MEKMKRKIKMLLAKRTSPTQKTSLKTMPKIRRQQQIIRNAKYKKPRSSIVVHCPDSDETNINESTESVASTKPNAKRSLSKDECVNVQSDMLSSTEQATNKKYRKRLQSSLDNLAEQIQTSLKHNVPQDDSASSSSAIDDILLPERKDDTPSSSDDSSSTFSYSPRVVRDNNVYDNVIHVISDSESDCGSDSTVEMDWNSTPVRNEDRLSESELEISQSSSAMSVGSSSKSFIKPDSVVKLNSYNSKAFVDEHLQTIDSADDSSTVDVVEDSQTSELLNDSPTSELLDDSPTSEHLEESQDLEATFVESPEEVDFFDNSENAPATDVKHPSSIVEQIYANDAGVGIFVIRPPHTLSFHGRFAVRVISGSVKILGYALKENDKFYDVYSPRGASFLSFDVLNINTLDIGIATKRLTELGINSRMAKTVLAKSIPSDCVLAFRQVQVDYIKFAEHYCAQQLLPTDYLKKSKPSNIETHLECCFLNNPINAIKINCRTQDLFQNLIARFRNALRVMFCGGKGEGKSTLTRYFVNTLLNTYPKVLYIDLDPGQPEFTIPGCVSAVLVEEPLLGPNFTHPKKPQKCIYVKDIDVANDPHGYIECVRLLRIECSSYENIPTIINYMGFTRFLGLSLVSAAVMIWNPRTIVQIHSENPKNNYIKNLSTDVVARESELFLKTKNFIQYDLVIIDSMVPKTSFWKLQARQIREMTIVSYFSKMLKIIGPDSSLLNAKSGVYVIGIESVKIKTFQHESSNILATVNGNLVGICTQIENNEEYRCHGWGIVRGIDYTTKKLYLSTPFDLEGTKLSVLIYGAVMLPPSVYMAADNVKGTVPYVSVGVPVSLSRVPKKTLFTAK